MKMINTILVSVLSCLSTSAAIDFRVDFDSETGKVKPMHSTGQGPLIGWCDFTMFKYLKEAGVPYARLHDVASQFGMNLYVDIPNIFRDFDADENDPKNYDFTYTDLYLKALVDNGVEPYFRLGVTIENSVRETKKAYRIYPPKDFAKWARICEHIVRHYNEGWADGFRYNITYWEIWNEADDFPDYRNAMWWGTWKQYCELYEAASKHLKTNFPNIKVGGYARCTAYSVNAAVRNLPPFPNEAYRDQCFAEFCAFIKERKCPLDFFSYHGYIDPEMVGPHADYHRKALDAIGYTKTELHLNEWLYRGDRSDYCWDKPAHASGIAAFIVALQNSKTDIGMIYDAKCKVSIYSPLFEPIKKKPGKAYWAFKDFNELYKLGTSVKVSWKGEAVKGIWATAAKGKDGAAVLLVNDTAEVQPLNADFGGREVSVCRITDADRDDAECSLPREMPAHSYLLVLLK